MANSLYALMPFVVMPMPAVFLFLVGLLFWRARRIRRFSFGAGVALLLAFSLPVVAKFVALPLTKAGVAASDPAAANVAAVVVLTAGAYPDGSGRWWAHEATAYRIGAADALRRKLSVPMIVSGGGTTPGAPAEAQTVVEQYGFKADPGVTIDGAAANTFESALNIRTAIKDKTARVAVVTSPYHAMRTAAVMRRAGIGAVVVLTDEWPWVGGGLVEDGSDFVPSIKGFGIVNRAISEYAAIVWYLAKGRIGFADL